MKFLSSLFSRMTRLRKWWQKEENNRLQGDKKQDVVSPITFVSQHDYPLCYKYCVDTHKYNVIGTIVDEEIVFDKIYPLRDNHIPRAYQYVFFRKAVPDAIKEDRKGERSETNFKTFIPKNVPQQVRINEDTSYVIGFLRNGKIVYYDQCLLGE